MKLAISNIAWPEQAVGEVADALVSAGVQGIEVAPTKWWPEPLKASREEVVARREEWENRGLPIIAAQALLFGQPQFQLFSLGPQRQEMKDYLKGMIELCAALGARALVFGSPKNRIRRDLPLEVAQPIAVEFFGELAEFAAQCDTCMVIEANPSQYGADYITTIGDAVKLVRDVHHPGLRLHVDTACMTMAGDDPAEELPQVSKMIAHCHLSEPALAPLGTGGVPHHEFSRVLHEIGYDGWISIEMRASDPFELRVVLESIREAQQNYLSTGTV